MIIAYATMACDICKLAMPMYASLPMCDECGQHICAKCCGVSDDESGSALCRECIREREVQMVNGDSGRAATSSSERERVARQLADFTKLLDEYDKVGALMRISMYSNDSDQDRSRAVQAYGDARNALVRWVLADRARVRAEMIERVIAELVVAEVALAVQAKESDWPPSAQWALVDARARIRKLAPAQTGE